MKHAFVEHYSISIALPDDYPAASGGVPYEVDWDGLLRGAEEHQNMQERLETLLGNGIIPLVAVFVPKTMEVKQK